MKPELACFQFLISRASIKTGWMLSGISILLTWLIIALFYSNEKNCHFFKKNMKMVKAKDQEKKHFWTNSQQCIFMLLQNKFKTSDSVWGWRISLLFWECHLSRCWLVKTWCSPIWYLCFNSLGILISKVQRHTDIGQAWVLLILMKFRNIPTASI